MKIFKIFYTTAIFLLLYSENPLEDTNIKKPICFKYHEFKIITLYPTVYNPNPSQTDNRPLETADGSIICLDKLKNKKIRWIGVSRNLHSYYNGILEFNDTVEVLNTKYSGKWIVKDLMNPIYKNSVDFLTYNDKYSPKDSIKVNIKHKTYEYCYNGSKN